MQRGALIEKRGCSLCFAAQFGPQTSIFISKQAHLHFFSFYFPCSRYLAVDQDSRMDMTRRAINFFIMLAFQIKLIFMPQ